MTGCDTPFMEAMDRLPDEHKRQAEELRLANEECDRLKRELKAARGETLDRDGTIGWLREQVRGLQAQVEQLTEDEPTLRQHRQLQRMHERQYDIIKRVQALPAKWRKEYEDSGHDFEFTTMPGCADELEEALR